MKLEELPRIPLRPELVQTDARDVRGLDLLGLRAPAEGVAIRLLDGVTTITPNVRYFSLRSWIIWRYHLLGGSDDWKAFSVFASKVEAAVAFASALSNDPTGGVVGRDLATSTVQKTDGPLTLSRLTKILAVSVYAGPSNNLGLGDLDGEVPGLTKERGIPLAAEFDRLVKDDEILSAIVATDETQTFTREKLVGLGSRLTMGRPLTTERDHLLKAVFPTVPRQLELPRIASYCLLLHACKLKTARVEEATVFDIVSAKDLSEVPEELHFICDGWTRFIVRDLLVLQHEAAVAQVLNRLVQSTSAEKRSSFREIIGSLVGDEMDVCLAGLELDSLKASQPISKLCRDVVDQMGEATTLRGLRRWHGRFREIDLMEKAEWMRTPLGLAMLPIGWIVACQRMEPGVLAQTVGFDLDGLAGASRLGIGSVLLREVKEWQNSQESIRNVIGWLLKRSVDQHLRIAWSRQAREPHKDVSLLQSDGDEWVYLKSFRPGRATSRLYQALNWLDQFELLDDTGITALGETILENGLATLRRYREASQ